MPYGFVATTLLAQVDASVGGKSGVNFGGYNNMVGVFSQPRFVICDPHLLTSLPEAEVLCGLAEVIKHGAIADKAKALIQLLREFGLPTALSLPKELVAEALRRDKKKSGSQINHRGIFQK